MQGRLSVPRQALRAATAAPPNPSPEPHLHIRPSPTALLSPNPRRQEPKGVAERTGLSLYTERRSPAEHFVL